MQSVSCHQVFINCIIIICMMRSVLLKDGGSECSMDYGVPAGSYLQRLESHIDWLRKRRKLSLYLQSSKRTKRLMGNLSSEKSNERRSYGDCVCACVCSVASDSFATLLTVVCQAPLSTGFFHQVAILASREPSWSRDWTSLSGVSCTARQILYKWTT